MSKPFLTTRECAHILELPSWYVRAEIRDQRLPAEVIPRPPRPGRSRAHPSIRIYPHDFAAYLERYHPRVSVIDWQQRIPTVEPTLKAPRRAYADLTDEQKRRSNARSYANTYQRRGHLAPHPCEVCGTTVDVQKHHPDYSQPLKVSWFCPTHHRAHHNT